ncbi:MAG: hypothetical protein ACRER0_06285 [Gammaproteobacteria bacterium]
MSKLVFSLGLCLLITACATTQPPAQKPAVTTSSGQSQMEVSRGTQETGDKLICTYSNPLGSHIPQRICMTKEQQAARQKADQEALRNQQNGVPPR